MLRLSTMHIGIKPFSCWAEMFEDTDGPSHFQAVLDDGSQLRRDGELEYLAPLHSTLFQP
jgi:hypothetical protein